MSQLSVDQAADALGVSHVQVGRLIDAGELVASTKIQASAVGLGGGTHILGGGFAAARTLRHKHVFERNVTSSEAAQTGARHRLVRPLDDGGRDSVIPS